MPSLVTRLEAVLRDGIQEVEDAPEIAALLEHCRTRLGQPCEVAFVGESGAGKTVLLETLLSSPSEPIALPTRTTVPIRLIGAEQNNTHYLAYDRSSQPFREIPIHQINRFLQSPPEELFFLVRGLQSPLLTGNRIALTDMPGYGTAAGQGKADALVAEYLNLSTLATGRVDGAVHVLDRTSPADPDEGQLLHHLARWLYPDGRPLNGICVVTQFDGDFDTLTPEIRGRECEDLCREYAGLFRAALFTSAPLEQAIDTLQSDPVLFMRLCRFLQAHPWEQIAPYLADATTFPPAAHPFTEDSELFTLPALRHLQTGRRWSAFKALLGLLSASLASSTSPGEMALPRAADAVRSFSGFGAFRTAFLRRFAGRGTSLHGYHIALQAAVLLREAEYTGASLPEREFARQQGDLLRQLESALQNVSTDSASRSPSRKSVAAIRKARTLAGTLNRGRPALSDRLRSLQRQIDALVRAFVWAQEVDEGLLLLDQWEKEHTISPSWPQPPNQLRALFVQFQGEGYEDPSLTSDPGAASRIWNHLSDRERQAAAVSAREWEHLQRTTRDPLEAALARLASSCWRRCLRS